MILFVLVFQDCKVNEILAGRVKVIDFEQVEIGQSIVI
jgi:hypothetical protein